jgi:hypothetical protein
MALYAMYAFSHDGFRNTGTRFKRTQNNTQAVTPRDSCNQNSAIQERKTNIITCNCGHSKEDHQFAKPGDMAAHFRTKPGDNRPRMFPVKNFGGYCTIGMCSCITFNKTKCRSRSSRSKS